MMLCRLLFVFTAAAAVNVTTPCTKLQSVLLSNVSVLSNGSLLAGDDVYQEGHFWEEMNDLNETEVRGCVCLLRNCVRKCCPEGMIIQESGECVASDHSLLHPFRPQFIHEETYDIANESDIDLHTLYGRPCSGDAYVLDVQQTPDDFHYLYRTGHLYVPALNQTFTPDEFCIDVFNEWNIILPLVCAPVLEEQPRDNVSILYPIGMIISIPFLFATFLVYAVLAELRNFHGMCFMSYIVSLCVAYVFLSIVQLQGPIEDIFCIVCAFVILFSFHASFFWLNVMCFDIWWTFSGLRPLRGSVKEREYKKFIMYSCYAWGAPLLMLLVCLIMDLVPGISSSYIKPEFGVEKCWFKTKDAALAYFFGPIGVIVLCNIILFIATAVKILQLKRETKMLKGGESMRHDDEANRQRFNLYLKLFVVMGVNWIMEVISWVAGGPDYLWYITDLGNTLQGVLIFIIFVWKRKIRKLLAKKFNPKLADTSSVYDGSVRSRPSTRTSSVNYTTRTSVSSPPDQMVMVSMMKPVPNGTYRVTEVP